jgi:protein-tyrosine phosphatase
MSRKKPRRYIYEVVKSRFSAGEYPGNVDDKKAKRKIDRMLRDGFTSFIDLTEEGETNNRNEPVLPYAHHLPEGVKYTRFPIPDVKFPKTMWQLLNIVDYIDEQLHFGEKVYLHCRGGFDRTSVVVTAWFIKNGMTAEDAVKEYTRCFVKNFDQKGMIPLVIDEYYDPDYIFRFHDWLKKEKQKFLEEDEIVRFSDDKITFAKFQLTDFKDISQKAHKNKAVLTNLQTGKSCRLQFVETQLLLKMLAKVGGYISYTDLADGIWTADGDEIPNLRGKLKVAIAKLKKNIASESVEISNHQYIKAYKLSLVNR